MAGKARGIQSVEVGGRILRALVKSGEPMMLRDLAQAADLAAAQCHAYLTSLKQAGLVHQDWDTGLYRMGPFAMQLGMAWLRSAPLPAASIKALRALTAELGYMSVLSIWAEHGPTIVHINEGAWPLPVNIRQGTHFSTTGSATGRICAAFGDFPNLKSLIDSELSESGPGSGRGIGDRLMHDEFVAEVAMVRACGYSTANERPIPGINAIAVPILDRNGKFAFAATLIAPSAHLPVDEGSVAIKRLLATVDAIAESAHAREKAVADET